MHYKIRAQIKQNFQNIKIKTISCVAINAAKLNIENKEEYDVNALTDVCQPAVCEDLM